MQLYSVKRYTLPFSVTTVILSYCNANRCHLYGTIRDAIITCAQKLTYVSLIYRTKPKKNYRRVTNIRISAHFTHLRKFRNFVFATEVTIFSDHNPLMCLRECAPKNTKLTRWALGLQEFMHVDSNIFHTSVKV